MLKLKLQCFGHLIWLIGKDPDNGTTWRQEEKGMTEDEMVGWHHQLDGHGFGWTPGVGDGQGGLMCCSSWGRKELGTTEQLNWTELNCCVSEYFLIYSLLYAVVDHRPTSGLYYFLDWSISFPACLQHSLYCCQINLGKEASLIWFSFS